MKASQEKNGFRSCTEMVCLSQVEAEVVNTVNSCTMSQTCSNAHSGITISADSHGHCGSIAQDESKKQIDFGHLRLKLEWVGPFEVAKRISEVDYEVATPGKKDAKKVPCELAEEAATAAFLALIEVRAGEWTESGLYGKALSHLKGQRRKHQMGCIFPLRLSMRVWKGYCRSFKTLQQTARKDLSGFPYYSCRTRSTNQAEGISCDLLTARTSAERE